jgi:hypothetical protein
MNMAEKYLQENIKTMEINGIEFVIRKYNPKDILIMGRHLQQTRAEAKKRLKEENKDCEDCPDEPITFTLEEIQKLGELDLHVTLTSCVISPKIVVKKYGTQNKDEIPYDILDSNTANKLFVGIEEYSLEVFEGVSFGSFPDEQTGGDSNENIDLLKHTSKSASGQLSTEDESLLEDEIRRIVRPIEGDGAEDKSRDIRRKSGKVRKKKTRIEREVQKKNNK